MKKLRWSIDVEAVAPLADQKEVAIAHFKAALDHLADIPSQVVVSTLKDAKPGRLTGGRLGAPHTAEGEYVDGWKGLWSATVVE
jgi:hypothetical protein